MYTMTSPAQLDLSLSKVQDRMKDREACPWIVCCSPWDRKDSDTTEQLNNNIYILNVHTYDL